MYDSKEIARRALSRAEEIKAEKERFRRRWQGAGALIGLCAVAVVIMVMILPTNSQPGFFSLPEDQMPLAAFLLPDENAKPFLGTTPDYDHSYAFLGFNSLTVPAGVCETQIVLHNPKENTCWFAFEIVLQDTEESLLTTGLIAPDMFIDGPLLLRPLAQGEYNAVLKIKTYDLENMAPLGLSSVYFTIIAE